MSCGVLGLAHKADDAKSKLKALEVLKDHIRQLQEQCRRLEGELVAQNRQVGSVRALPREVLSIIFSFYLEGSPRNIRRLMLVCKQWYNVAVSNSHFWTRIRIEEDGYVGDFKGRANDIEPFIKACVQRSGTVLLHISLDFSSIPSWDRYIEEKMTSTLTHLYPDLSWHTTHDWVQEQDWSWCEVNGDDPPGQPSHLMRLLSFLGSKDRWESLNVSLPDDHDLATDLLLKISGDMPHLKSLSISEYMDHELDETEMAFTDLTSLTYLKVPNLEYLRMIDPPLSLEQLEVNVHLTQETVEILNRFAKLHTLKLSSSYGPTPLSEKDKIVLKLPNLHALHIVGGSIRPSDIKFELPVLQDLFLIDQSMDFFNALPDLSPTQINWYSMWIHGVMIENLVTRYPHAVQHITSHPYDKQGLLGAIKRLKSEGKLKSGLGTITFELYGGIKEVIPLDDV